MFFYLLILPQSCIIAIYASMIYTAPYVMFFYVCRSITRASGKPGLGPVTFGAHRKLGHFAVEVGGAKRKEWCCKKYFKRISAANS